MATAIVGESDPCSHRHLPRNTALGQSEGEAPLGAVVGAADESIADGLTESLLQGYFSDEVGLRWSAFFPLVEEKEELGGIEAGGGMAE
tara:strand:- start:55 stop:321 length:267 start_codon:yes stop_codon:yes gene_type:complete